VGTFRSALLHARQLTVAVLRSGIGANEILEKYGIQMVSDLPGVGQNYNGKFNSMITLG
jgi:choline dehydrogenase-like flavoprotein